MSKTINSGVIVGGGPIGKLTRQLTLVEKYLNLAPAGLTAAIMLARRGYNVNIYDRLEEPTPPDSMEWGKSLGERNYNIGLNGRGQKVLRHF